MNHNERNEGAKKMTTHESQFATFITQDMFESIKVYSNLDGDTPVRFHGNFQSPEEGFCCVSVKPWAIQVQECVDGVWRVVAQHDGYWTKEEAIADAKRMGIVAGDLDYVGWQKNSVRVSPITKEVRARTMGLTG